MNKVNGSLMWLLMTIMANDGQPTNRRVMNDLYFGRSWWRARHWARWKNQSPLPRNAGVVYTQSILLEQSTPTSLEVEDLDPR